MADGEEMAAKIFLVPRAPDGELSEFGEGIASVVSPQGFTFNTDRDDQPGSDDPSGAILAELQDLLADPGVQVPNPNPFLVLKREFDADMTMEEGLPLAACHCECGSTLACGGGGGGH
jgi:hypothetical protein